MRILSFDASTTTIGYAILESEPLKLIHVGYFKPNKKLSLFERLVSVKKLVLELIDGYQPNEIALEDILLFMPGKSNATTITSLAVLNRTVGLTIFEATDKAPILLNVTSIRHKLKINEYPKKEDIPELVAKKLDINFPYKYNKKNEIIVENFDQADAIAVGLAYILGLRPAVKIKKKRKKKK
jgi:Holliday junction resolvasome RuvABC endonuclease subunit